MVIMLFMFIYSLFGLQFFKLAHSHQCHVAIEKTVMEGNETVSQIQWKSIKPAIFCLPTRDSCPAEGKPKMFTDVLYGSAKYGAHLGTTKCMPAPQAKKRHQMLGYNNITVAMANNFQVIRRGPPWAAELMHPVMMAVGDASVLYFILEICLLSF